MKYIERIAIMGLFMLLAPAGATAGPFGPPEPSVKGTAGLHTAIGYWLQEDRYGNDVERITRQNQVFSELGYGFRTGWEVTARIGRSDFKIVDAFSPSNASTTTRMDFEENAKFFGTLGAKGFYPAGKSFGLGAFLQGTYYFSDFTDTVSGTRSGIPFAAGLRVQNFWDVNFGIGLQATGPGDIKIYLGPYLHYSEFKTLSSPDSAGLVLGSGETILRNKSVSGGFAGIEVPLAKGFRLNLEGQYSERLSAGATVIYLY